ncbi:MAG: NUDIX hydrolase [Endomicrobiaceae bacterium]|nr:NUDIX hydrolase [Endomicrobiaceae bacterium]
MKLIEKTYKKEKVYYGKAVNFCNDVVLLPNNQKATREYIDHPGAVAVIPFLNKKDIILVKQFRYPINKITYEIPAGKLDKKESLIKCVKRELKEETGYSAKKIKKLLSFWPTPAFSNEVLHIYIATELSSGKNCPDDDEFVENVIISYKEALQMVKNGKIKDSKTIIALTYLGLDNK